MNALFVSAVERNDLVEVERLIREDGVGVDSKHYSLTGITALNTAIMNGHEEMTRLLIRCGADIHLEWRAGWVPLHVAIQEEGNIRMACLLLEHGADPNSHDHLLGKTALMRAIEKENVQMICLFLANGADINKSEQNHKRRTPLHIAIAEDRSIQCLKVLLRNGADPRALDASGDSPFITALKGKRWDHFDEILQCTNVNDFKGCHRDMPALIQAVSWFDWKDELECTEGLLLRGADPNIRWSAEDNITPMLVCVRDFARTNRRYIKRSKTFPMLRALIHYGADVNLAECHGNTPLMCAMSDDSEKMSHFLLEESKADSIHQTNESGNSAFMLAVSAGRVRTTYLILRNNLGHFIPGMIEATRNAEAATTNNKKKRKQGSLVA